MKKKKVLDQAVMRAEHMETQSRDEHLQRGQSTHEYMKLSRNNILLLIWS